MFKLIFMCGKLQCKNKMCQMFSILQFTLGNPQNFRQNVMNILKLSKEKKMFLDQVKGVQKINILMLEKTH